MRLITVNDADTAVITATPAAVSSMPTSNLQDPSRRKVRCTTLTNQELKLVWSSARVLSAVALLRHNLTSSATWRVRIYDDAAATNLVYDSGVQLASPPKVLGDLVWGIDPLGASLFTSWAYAFSTIWFTPIAGMVMIITLNDTTNPDGFIEAARLFTGAYIEPINGPSYGLRLGWREATKQRRTDGGSLRSDPAEPYRALSVNLDWLDEGDRARLTEIGRRVGLRNDIFLSIYPGAGGALERDNTMQCKLTASIEPTRANAIRYEVPLTFEEA